MRGRPLGHRTSPQHWQSPKSSNSPHRRNEAMRVSRRRRASSAPRAKLRLGTSHRRARRCLPAERPQTILRQRQNPQPSRSPIAATRRCEAGRQAAERAVCPIEELDETARVRPVRQIRGLVRAWRTKVREPSGAREAGVLDAAAASSRLKRAKKMAARRRPFF
jgi:hypothetical protein